MSLIINDLTKTFHKASVPALDHVNLSFEPGIHGLFGRNGAGKSTLLATVANRLLPTGGDVELDGEDVRDNEYAQVRIHLVNETTPFLMPARVSALLRREGRYYGGIDGEEVARMLAAFGIRENDSYGGLSLGQRQIVRLVAGLCLPVDVLLLDEPVNGLDAANRERFYRLLIESYAERPRVIVVSTHIIDEVAQVVERAVILDHGRVVDAFDAGDVASRATVLVGDGTRVNAFIGAEGLQPVAVERMGRLVTVTVRGRVDEHDVPDGIAVSGLGLQDYFIRVTGEGGMAGKQRGGGIADGGAADDAGTTEERKVA